MDYGTRLKMYSKSGCPHCDRARTFLTDHNIPFAEIKLEDRAEREKLYDQFKLAGSQRSVPQIVLTDCGEDFRLGGADDLIRREGPGLIGLFFGKVAEEMRPAQTVRTVESLAPVADEDPECCT